VTQKSATAALGGAPDRIEVIETYRGGRRFRFD
jgi:hypothetical protein